MNIRRSGLIAVLLVPLLTCAVSLAAEQKVLFQTSTLQALMNGVYDSDYSFRDLTKHGDFGLGTFEALDGEMVAAGRQILPGEDRRQGLSRVPQPRKRLSAKSPSFKAIRPWNSIANPWT